MTTPEAVIWTGGALRLLDQRALPESINYLPQDTLADVVDSIRNLTVRGAPAIGIAAAYGMVVAAEEGAEPGDAAAQLRAARPTAVNLAWAVNRMLAVAESCDPEDRLSAMTAEARAIHQEDRWMCQAIGNHGEGLISDGAGVLTHCNAGALAVSELGTATAPMYVAHANGRRFRVFVDETRPVLQGARLTAWELDAAGLDVTLICDGAAAHLMSEGAITVAIVGADRVTANGDVVNKIGTRSVAIACNFHAIPFYVALPTSTFDPDAPTGADVPIEERDADEVVATIRAAAGVGVRNPAFDVTPAELVTGYITERGLLTSVDELKVGPR